QTAAQAVGRAERDRAHDAVAELLLHFERECGAFELQRVIHLGHRVAGELDVHHRADALNNFAVSHVSSFESYSLRRQTAAAPATISDSSLVIAAWRVLL